MEVVLDVETTSHEGSPSPYKPENNLVMVQYSFVGVDEPILNPHKGGAPISPEGYFWFNHKDFDGDARRSFEQVQTILNITSRLVGHNIKFDLSWLYECGFTYEGQVWDTMIFEYLQAKGLKPQLDLTSCAERRGCEFTKTSFLTDNFKAGINTDEMEPEGLVTYGMADIHTTEELYLRQRHLLSTDNDTKTMKPAMDLMHEMLVVLTDMERAGCNIDLERLAELEKEYSLEREHLKEKLEDLTYDIMGDKPYNLNSKEQLCQVVYGFRFKSKEAKKQWVERFDVGTELRNGVKKKKYPKKLSDRAIKKLMQELTAPVYKTEARHCDACDGRGHFYKVKKDGELFKKPTKCSSCDGAGMQYIETGERAGFCLGHPGTWHATANGFSVGKDVIDMLLERAASKKRLNSRGQKAVEFLEACSRLNAVNTYIDTYVKQVYTYNVNGILHGNFNQCIAATGRLTATSPNLQNQSGGHKFPIKSVFISKFKGGKILSCDLAQIEFRAAALLSQCKDTIKFITEKNDIHIISAEHHGVTRQEGKAHSFRPLYGGQGDWTEQFYDMFPGIREWHKRLGEEALNNKQIVSPSGRIYAFPNARRDVDKMGRPIVKPATQICNYPVQGFAGDMMYSICIKIHELCKKNNTKSHLILTVHDDITADVHPDEVDLMVGIFREAFDSVYSECKRRFGIDINVEIGYELEIGDNWLEKTEVKEN